METRVFRSYSTFTAGQIRGRYLTIARDKIVARIKITVAIAKVPFEHTRGSREKCNCPATVLQPPDSASP